MKMIISSSKMPIDLSTYCSTNYPFLRVGRTNFSFPGLSSGVSYGRLNSFSSTRTKLIFQADKKSPNGNRVGVISPKLSSPICNSRLLGGFFDALDDEYGGIIVDSDRLPSNINIFASMLRASLSNWKSKGKKGIWLKILKEQSELVHVAIKEGFNYHHAEAGYVMLTYWIPDGPCMLPDGPSHQIGVGGFVINENREVLVVKEKLCPCRCSGVWKLPTGYINKSEEIFSGVVREVKEETGIDTKFSEVVAFRHVHNIAFEKLDLLFICMLRPLSFDIAIDDKEIQDAKWMSFDEFVAQPFYEEDHMSKRVIDTCIAAYENCYSGFTGHRLTSKFDGKSSYLYYNDASKT